jgi:tetratricopeptide (TPR) repeat protein
MTFRSVSSSFQRLVLTALLAALLPVLFTARELSAQGDPSDLSGRLPVQQRIHNQLSLLHDREQAQASAHELGYRWALLGAEYSTAGDFVDSENSYNRSLQLLSADTSATALYANVLDQFGALYRIYDRIPESLSCRRRALALRQQMGDPLEVARSKSHLAELALMSRKFKDAFGSAGEAYEIMIRLQDPDKTDLISTLVVRSYAECALHKCDRAVEDARQAAAISRNAFGAESMPTGAALIVLGSAALKAGATDEAANSTRQALQIFKVQLTPADPRLNYAMLQYRDCLLARHQRREAQDIDDQLSALNRQSAPSCPSCTVSVFGLRTAAH